ncbi:MAG: hypothetical protein ISS76_12245 [Phycisphaerae bacterium]|nr:hypothetical protein [Phycisphaerae bacterium]
MIQLAYILAASYSGSTLLSMLLGSHSQLPTVGELKLSASAMGERGFGFDVSCAGNDYSEVESWDPRRLLGPLHKEKLVEGYSVD